MCCRVVFGRIVVGCVSELYPTEFWTYWFPAVGLDDRERSISLIVSDWIEGTVRRWLGVAAILGISNAFRARDDRFQQENTLVTARRIVKTVYGPGHFGIAAASAGGFRRRE